MRLDELPWQRLAPGAQIAMLTRIKVYKVDRLGGTVYHIYTMHDALPPWRDLDPITAQAILFEVTHESNPKIT